MNIQEITKYKNSVKNTFPETISSLLFLRKQKQKHFLLTIRAYVETNELNLKVIHKL